VLVTHDMGWVTEFCNRALLIEKGEVIAQGEPADVVATHLEHAEQAKREKLEQVRRYGGEAPKLQR
jgi:ABC-type polysaccharide/polyol phosphate transport system ATPase subunit